MSATETKYLSQEHIERLAEQVLQRHRVEFPPVDPIRIASGERIVVLPARMKGDVGGRLWLRHDNRWQIDLNQGHALQRQRFTVAHELGHYFLHREQSNEFVDRELQFYRHGPDQDGDRRQEIQANAFAASLLMPEVWLRAIHAKGQPSLERMSMVFGVSYAAMGYRMGGLDIG